MKWLVATWGEVIGIPIPLRQGSLNEGLLGNQKSHSQQGQPLPLNINKGFHHKDVSIAITNTLKINETVKKS